MTAAAPPPPASGKEAGEDVGIGRANVRSV